MLRHPKCYPIIPYFQLHDLAGVIVHSTKRLHYCRHNKNEVTAITLFLLRLKKFNPSLFELHFLVLDCVATGPPACILRRRFCCCWRMLIMISSLCVTDDDGLDRNCVSFSFSCLGIVFVVEMVWTWSYADIGRKRLMKHLLYLCSCLRNLLISLGW